MVFDPFCRNFQAVASLMLLARARERVFAGFQSHFAARGGAHPTGHLKAGPMIIKLHTSASEN
jgi:hypothetical protein